MANGVLTGGSMEQEQLRFHGYASQQSQRNQRNHISPAKTPSTAFSATNAGNTDATLYMGLQVKYWALIILILQNSSLVLLMRYTRTITAAGQPMYIASTAVFFMEILKLCTCCYLLFMSRGASLHKLIWTIKHDVVQDTKETLKMLVPSLLYAIQNNLLFVALSNLDAATFQVTYQAKILTTAICSVLMLGRSLTRMKWFSLLLLVVGVALVQIQSMTNSPATKEDEVRIYPRVADPPLNTENVDSDPRLPPDIAREAFVLDKIQAEPVNNEINDIFSLQKDPVEARVPASDNVFDTTMEHQRLSRNWRKRRSELNNVPPSYLPQDELKDINENDEELQVGRHLMSSSTKKYATKKSEEVKNQNPLLGLTAVALACLSSGFAGVYFEKILKRSNSDIWVRNIQLGVFGTLFSLVGMLLNDWNAISTAGIFSGYNALAWLVVINQAVGGLVVAIVVKYADNILKGFATSVSIIVSGVFSVVLFDFRPSMQFTVGASVVMMAVYLYGRPDSHHAKK